MGSFWWCAVACRVLQTRNVKPRTKDEQGQQKKVESLIHHSNVMHYSTTQQVCSHCSLISSFCCYIHVRAPGTPQTCPVVSGLL